ncbi:MAG: polysaccharide deacetylase family protein, partial [Chloroflexi bacterium]|nr:polysaccharide deacetylase family protein [Chloroflexota bacterium]
MDRRQRGRITRVQTGLGFSAVALLFLGINSIWGAATCPRWSIFGPVIWRGPSQRRVVALTFDDGPDPRWTPAILATLRQERVPATFFVLGTAATRYPQLLRAESRGGSEIGDHSWDHRDFRWLSPSSVAKELDSTQRAIRRATGVSPHLFRPPYGRRSIFVWPEARSRGLKMVGWSLSPWRGRSPTAGDLVRRTLRLCRPGDIILLHDGRGNRRQTVEALPLVIGA